MYLIGWLSLHCLVLFWEPWPVLWLVTYFFIFVPCYIVRGGALGIHGAGQPLSLLWCCMWVRGLRGNNATCFRLAFSHFPCYPQANWALLTWFPGGCICVCSRTLWVSPTNSPMSLGASPTTANPTGFHSQGFRGFVSLRWNPGLHSLSRSLVVPPSLFAHKCGTAWSVSCQLVRSTTEETF